MQPFHEGTDFPGDKYRKVCDGKLDYAVSLLKGKRMEAGYKSMLDSHIRSHRDLYGRVRIQLPASVEDKLPTDVRLRNIDEGGLTPGLAELYYNFGRYLLISSTRPGSLPPNLQGLR